MTTRPFATWPMLATGGTTGRVMPDRLADVRNVKDFGAIGDGATQDDVFINAAIQQCIADGGGTVFFPHGTYKLGASLQVGSDTLTGGVRLIGTGKNSGTQFTYTGGYTSVDGYTISKGSYANDCLEMVSGFYNASVKGTRDDVIIEDVTGYAGADSIAFEVSTADNAMIRGCAPIGGGRAAANVALVAGQYYPGTTPGSVGINLGRGVVTGCRGGDGLDIVICMSGNGSVAISNSFENVGCAVRVGWDAVAAAELASEGAVIMGLQTEKGMEGIVLYNATAAYVSGNILTGGAGMPTGQAFTNGSYNGGTSVATMTVGSAHNLPVGTSRVQIIGTVDNLSWAPSVSGSLDHLGQGITTVTYVSPTTFSYRLTATPSSFNTGAEATLHWTWPNRYALRCRTVSDSVISAFVPSLSAAFASIDLDYDGAADANNNVIEGTSGTYGWKLPTDAHNLAAWKFINCRGGASDPISNGNPSTPYGTMVFADLPGQTLVTQAGPFEGQEYDIIDGNSSAFDATQTGGGSGHYKVRYNGTNWKRIG